MWSSSPHGYEARTGHVSGWIPKPFKCNDGVVRVFFSPKFQLDVVWLDSNPYVFYKNVWVKLPSPITYGYKDDEWAAKFFDRHKQENSINDMTLIKNILKVQESEKKKKSDLPEKKPEEGYLNAFLGWMMGSKRVSTVFEGPETIDLPVEKEQTVIVAQPAVNSPKRKSK